MGFFVTSAGSGKGGDLGGLASADGTAFAPQGDSSCKGWTSSGEGSAIVGHHDRNGPLPEAWAQSWNFSHPSAGCSQEALVRTGGAGRFHCFAADGR